MSDKNKQIADAYDDLDKESADTPAIVQRLLNDAPENFGEDQSLHYYMMSSYLARSGLVDFETVLQSKHMSYLYERDRKKVADIIEVCLYALPDEKIEEAVTYALSGSFAIELAQQHPDEYTSLVYTCFYKTPDAIKPRLFSSVPENPKLSDDFVIHPKIAEDLPTVIIISRDRFGGSAGFSSFYGRQIRYDYYHAPFGVADEATLKRISVPEELRRGRDLRFPGAAETLANMLKAIAVVEPTNPCLNAFSQVTPVAYPLPGRAP